MANPLICVFNPVTSFIDEIQSVSSGPATNGIPIVTNLLGVIDTSLLGIGSIATAGQTLSAGQLVNLYSFAGSLHAQVASAQSPTVPNPTPPTPPSGGSYPLQAQGFAASSATVNTPLTISFFGTFKYIDGNAEFHASDIGAEVYLSDRGDGSPTLTPPSGGGELEQSVGYVVAFVSPNVVTINFASGFQDFSHISGVNPITKGGTGATTASQALLNLIGTATTGQALIYNGTNWVPGTDVTTFGQITTGTNTTATMTVGTGASLTFSGTGTINANQLTGDPVNTAGRTTGQALVWSGSAWAPSNAANTLFTNITTGTNTTATMTVGTGASLTFSGTGVVNANQIIGTAISTITGSGALVLATSPTISGATLSGSITVSGNLSYTTANPAFFAATGSGNVVLATSPLISGATLSGAITISGTATYTTANPTFFSAQGNGSKVQLSTGTTTTGDVVTFDANGNTVDSATLLTSLAPKASPTFTGEVTLARLKASSPDAAGVVAFAGATTVVYTFASAYTGTNPPVVVITPQFDAGGNNADFWVTYTGGAGAWTAFTIHNSLAQTGNVNYIVIDIG